MGRTDAAAYRGSFRRLCRRIAWPALVVAPTLLFIACTFRPVVEGDGVSNYAYLHTVIVDHDLDLSNEFQAARASHIPVFRQNITTRTKTGKVADFTPVGSSLLGSPAYMAALLLDPDGNPVFERQFTTAFTIASLLYGLVGLGLIAVFVALAVSVPIRRAVTFTLLGALASPFVYYLLFDPSYTHTFSVFGSATFLLFWWRTGATRSGKQWIVLGLLGGLLAAIRYQDGALMAIALIDVPRSRWRSALFIPGAVASFLPQLVVQRTIFGTWLPSRPALATGVNLWPGHYLDVLLSSHNGLFVWSPVLVFALVGIAMIRDGRLQAACAVAIAVELFVSGIQPDWWGGRSFGMKRLLDLLPVFTVGLATLGSRIPRPAAVIGGLAFVAWNALAIANFDYIIRTDRDPGYLGFLAGQVDAVTYLPRLAAKGATFRSLALAPVVHMKFDLLYGSVLLVIEVVVLSVAVFVTWTLLRRLNGHMENPRDVVASTHITS